MPHSHRKFSRPDVQDTKVVVMMFKRHEWHTQPESLRWAARDDGLPDRKSGLPNRKRALCFRSALTHDKLVLAFSSWNIGNMTLWQQHIKIKKKERCKRGIQPINGSKDVPKRLLLAFSRRSGGEIIMAATFSNINSSGCNHNSRSSSSLLFKEIGSGVPSSGFSNEILSTSRAFSILTRSY